MTPEEELGMTLDQLIYKYAACGSRVADLLRELKEARQLLREVRGDEKRLGWIDCLDPYYYGEEYRDFCARLDAAMETK